MGIYTTQHCTAYIIYVYKNVLDVLLKKTNFYIDGLDNLMKEASSTTNTRTTFTMKEREKRILFGFLYFLQFCFFFLLGTMNIMKQFAARYPQEGTKKKQNTKPYAVVIWLNERTHTHKYMLLLATTVFVDTIRKSTPIWPGKNYWCH